VLSFKVNTGTNFQIKTGEKLNFIYRAEGSENQIRKWEADLNRNLAYAKWKLSVEGGRVNVEAVIVKNPLWFYGIIAGIGAVTGWLVKEALVEVRKTITNPVIYLAVIVAGIYIIKKTG